MMVLKLCCMKFLQIENLQQNSDVPMLFFAKKMQFFTFVSSAKGSRISPSLRPCSAPP
jgi:hypothetical protein